MSASGSTAVRAGGRMVAVGAISLMLVLSLFQQSKLDHAKVPPGLKPRARVLENFGKLPLAFEENRGQAGAAADFVTRGGNFQVMLDRAGATFMMAGPAGAPVPVKDAKASPMGMPRVKFSELRMNLAGAATASRGQAQERLPGIVNYYHGNDPAKWQTNVPTYRRVKYEHVYPGSISPTIEIAAALSLISN
jgi:hypothetical protein